MTTYNSVANYRKIWSDHYGPIPKDKEGRSYEIHHIDGNHSNNDIANLKCVSIQEHYEIHHAQNDFYAAARIAAKMNKTHEEISVLMSLAAKKRVEEGTHHFVGGEQSRKNALKLVEQGTHPFLGGVIQRSSNLSRVANGTHPSQTKIRCPHCDKEVDKANYSRSHGDKCSALVGIIKRPNIAKSRRGLNFYNVYEFRHKDGTTLFCTVNDLQQRFGRDSIRLYDLIGAPRKHFKGWRIIRQVWPLLNFYVSPQP